MSTYTEDELRRRFEACYIASGFDPPKYREPDMWFCGGPVWFTACDLGGKRIDEDTRPELYDGE
jgi:hypothetical protein